jgi:hypothetical protein
LDKVGKLPSTQRINCWLSTNLCTIS